MTLSYGLETTETEKWFLTFGEPMAIWDTTIFLYAIGFEWFLDDLFGRKPLKSE